MAESKLIIPSHPADATGKMLSVTPHSAGWDHVGFEAYRLAKGQKLAQSTGVREAALVLLSGKANVAAGRQSWKEIGERMNVFEQSPPYAVYVPAHEDWELEAVTEVELAVCFAPGLSGYRARLIPPADVGVEHRGSGSTARLVHNILPEQEPAHSLLVVEVFTPSGHWSSYPPHKHDRDALPEESLLEETYYYRIQPEQGFAIQRVYTDDRALDETLTVRDRDVVLVPRGYHPVSAPPGYDLYYLNVMAGPKRTWRFRNDPDHDWLAR